MNLRIATLGLAVDRLVGQVEELRGSLTVVRRCVEFRELIAACQSGLADIALLAEQTEEVNSALLDRLLACHAVLVVLSDDSSEVARLTALGVLVFPLDSDAQQIATALSAGRGESSTEKTVSGFRDSSMAAALDDRGEGCSHRIIAVWGPAGAPGRTTVAVNIAAELAAQGQEVMLIDADSYAASVAATLGILDESAGLAQAARLADQGLLNEASLSKVCAEVTFRGGRLRALSGLTRPDRWPELRSSALSRVFELCQQLFELTIIDCGFCLESDEELSFDNYVPRRNAATLVALRAADQIVAVGAADSIGVPRLIRALDELKNICPSQEVMVLLNKVRRGAAGRLPEQAIMQAWLRFGPQYSIQGFLPSEPELLDQALFSGEVLLEAGPDSALRKKLLVVVGALAQQSS